MSNYHRLKEECYLANLALPEHRLVDLTFDNVSTADLQQGVFAIKPSGVSYATLRAEDIIIVGIADGNIAEGSLRPSSDTPTHRRLFQAFAAKGTGAPDRSDVPVMVPTRRPWVFTLIARDFLPSIFLSYSTGSAAGASGPPLLP